MNISYLKSPSKLILGVFVFIAFYGCDDFLEKDISDYSVDLYYPSDSIEYNNDTIRFLWSEVDDVTTYNLKILRYQNSTKQNLIIDTLLSNNSISVILEAGTYEWQVIGLNSIYQTLGSSKSLTVYPPAVQIRNEVVILLSPTDELETMDSNLLLWWEEVEIASSYNLQIVSPDFNSPQDLLLDTILTVNSHSLDLGIGSYEWRVCAIDSTTQMDFTKRSFKIIGDSNFENEAVNLLAPTNNLETTNATITLWWEEVNQSVSHKLQIVKPNFNSTEELILDTVILGDSYTVNLGVGDYEWRVCAINSYNQETLYSTSSFSIVNEDDIQYEQVVLLAPADNLEATTHTITFWWEKISNATSYVIQIVSPDFRQTELLILDEELNGNSKTLTLEAGQYQWRVKAVNETSETYFSTRTLTVLP